VVYYSYLFALLGLAIFEGIPGHRLNALRRALMLAVAAGIVFVLHVLLYITWTPPESRVIMGIQGRYFIPVAPLLFVMVSGLVYNLKIRRLAHVAAAIYLPVVLALVLRAVVIRYYSGW
jgi:uncharacterized membrane protein